MAHQRSVHHAVEEIVLGGLFLVSVFVLVLPGSLKLSPRESTAQAMRAFFAAIATTAFQ